MPVVSRIELLRATAGLIQATHGPLAIHALEIGAAPIEGHAEPLHQILELLPGSTITAFEIDPQLCQRLNAQAPPGLRYFPVALGRRNEVRKLHITADPMCSSLYEPNVPLIRQYCHMEGALPRSSGSIATVGLDWFATTEGLHDIDFIKIDIQGGELDVFEGALDTLRDVSMIVTEVEFIPQYVDQPLFGDVAAFLSRQDFMLQAFLSFGRRALNPFIVNDPNKGTHFVWADALFIRNILLLENLADGKLLKMAVLAVIHGGEDLAFRCLHIVDGRRRTDLSQRFVAMLDIG